MKQGLFICLLSLLFWGCTQNNGHIGVNFGMWKLEELTINGEPDTAYLDNVVWKFHSSILSMVRISDHHEVFECYGTWSESDDNKQMFLNFSPITTTAARGNTSHSRKPTSPKDFPPWTSSAARTAKCTCATPPTTARATSTGWRSGEHSVIWIQLSVICVTLRKRFGLSLQTNESPFKFK